MNRTILDISSEIGSGITPLRSKAEYWNSNDIPWVKTEQLGEYQIFDANEYISKTALKETTIKLWPPKLYLLQCMEREKHAGMLRF